MGTWFGFRTRDDLLAKLRRDLDRLRSDPANGDAAFNFFVTAWSLIDWFHPKDKNTKRMLRQTHPIVAAVAHLGDGCKHLQLSDPTHVSVANTATGGNVGARPLGLSPGQQPVSPSTHFIELTGDAAAHFGKYPSAVALAEKAEEWILNYAATLP